MSDERNMTAEDRREDESDRVVWNCPRGMPKLLLVFTDAKIVRLISYGERECTIPISQAPIVYSDWSDPPSFGYYIVESPGVAVRQSEGM